MAERPKKKNISPYLADIRHPKRPIRDERKPFFFNKKEETRDKPFQLKIKVSSLTPLRRYLILAAGFTGVIVVAVVLFYGLFWPSFQSAPRDFERATNFLGSNARGDGRAGEETENVSLSQFFAVLRSMPVILASVKNLNQMSLEVATSIAELKVRGFQWLFEDGEALLRSLKDLEKKFGQLDSLFGGIYRQMADWDVRDGTSAAYLSVEERLAIVRDFLAGLIEFLSGENRLLVFLENGSEIRPAGGFIGSYAEVKIKGGRIEDIKVRDILVPDKLWNSRVIPPKPLQLITESWEARDANWFFDFPTSAQKTIGFIEASPFYAEENIQFAGAVALNHRVIGDILKITGPIELPSYGLKLDENNFLFKIQEEVSTDAFKRGSERKQILEELAMPLIEALKQLDAKKQEELWNLIANRTRNKDIRFYFKDHRLQNFFAKFGGDGSVYSLPDNFSGDYLAVVNANVGSGKSDIFISQQIILRSQLTDDGNLKNHLQIIRSHTAEPLQPDYYRAVNENFIRILTPPAAELLSLSGGSDRTIRPPINYAKAGYRSDPDVLLLEQGEEAGKQVFGSWFNVRPGETGRLELYYERPGALSGNVFQFVYEKQSGVDSFLEYHLEAPPGYIFVESGKREFVYKTESVPARLIINLTLKKNQ